MSNYVYRVPSTGTEITAWAPSETDARRYAESAGVEYVRPVASKREAPFGRTFRLAKAERAK